MFKESEIKALVVLLDDEDHEVVSHVEQKIMSIGTSVIPLLEQEWESTFNPIIQGKIEDLVHELQFELLKERFLEWKDNHEDNLLEGLWIVATYLYPDLEKDELSRQLDQLYHELWRHMEDKMTPYDRIKVFNEVFFNKFKFRANTKNFHSPANSMINSVLETKKGNPISLCAVYLLLAQKMDLPIFGVNLPNLFILTYQVGEESFYINVFNRGLVFTREDIDNYLESLQLEKKDIFYDPCTNLDIILRALRNLIVSFEKLGDYHKADEMKMILQKMDDQYFSL
ncbi:MAG: transglutaminase-like domain-containing protein [Ekhidna sp.]|uniref:transglutaminase-like domain-containing protein n=1 Tax=Ekhidna sp. TaxID=2608089 RepID=UPI0032ECD337